MPLHAQTWSTVGDNTQILNFDSVTHQGTVFVIKQIDSLLYVGGGFLYAGDIRVNSVATWNGTKWDSLGNGMGQYGVAYDFCKINNEIYCGGLWFEKFNGSSWTTVGSGLTTNNVKALKYKNKLYLGGNNIQLNSATLNNIASWDGSNYAGLSGGVIGPFAQINALSEYNNELIAGGVFNYAGGNIAFNIAAWNGSNWHDLDTGTSDIVDALVVDSINNFLYVGGGFTSAGGLYGVNSTAIARWDGFQWESVDTGLPMADIFALTFYRNKLFAGISGITGAISDTILAEFNGNKWTRILGPNSAIKALCVYKDELYVGGYFTMVGQDSVFGIARYYEPPDTSCDYLQAIIQPKNAVLKISDSTTVHFYNNIIHGSSWHWDFGDGGTDTVRLPIYTYTSAGVYNVSVVVTYQNCTDTAYTTITIVDDAGIKDNYKDTTEYLGQNIPNPFDNSTSIPYYIPFGSKGYLQITNTKGELINKYNLQQGKNKLDVSLANLKSGVYYYSIFINGMKKKTLKMLIK